MIFAPSCFLGISDEIDARDMMMMPSSPRRIREKNDSARWCSVVDAVSSWWLTRFIENLACNEFQPALIGVNDGSLGDPSADERNGGVLGGEQLGQRATVAFAHQDDDLALSRLVLGEPAVNPISARFSGRTWPQNSAVDFRDLSSPPIVNPRNAEAIASRSLCARTNAVLY